MKKTALATLLSGLFVMSNANATPFDIKMVADNDFAIFSGTSSSINNLLYQNNVVWNSQISTLSTLSFNLAAGDDTFYVLGMGGGGQENISGEVNGVNMTNSSVSVSMSSNIASFLTGYNGTTVENGTFNALLADVQSAFSSSTTTWGSAAPNLNSTDIVIVQGGFGSGYHFNNMNAHLFAFDAGRVNVPTTSVSEPATFALFGLGIAALGFSRRRVKQD